MLTDYFNEPAKLVIIAVTFPPIQELANDLKIADLVVAIVSTVPVGSAGDLEFGAVILTGSKPVPRSRKESK